MIGFLDQPKSNDVLAGLEWVGAVASSEGALLVETDRAADLSEALAGRGIYLHELRTVSTSLEEYFLEVTEEESG